MPETVTINIPFAQTTGWSSGGCCGFADYRVGQGPGTVLSATFPDPLAAGGTLTGVQVVSAVEHACNSTPANAMDFKLNGTQIGIWNSLNGPDCACSNPALGNATFNPAPSLYVRNANNTVSITHNAIGTCREALRSVPTAPPGTAFRIILTKTCP
jgi:hypothetical protein